VRRTPSFEITTPVPMELRRPAPAPARMMTVAAYLAPGVAVH
jgi:hypothetical protein